jgi:ribosome recycling factor
MDIIAQVKAKMVLAIEHFKEELKGIRTGRANTAMLDNVMVETYGSQMRIKDVASITAPDSRQLLITPFDPQTKGSIGKAIEKANLGFMPIVDGNSVRIKIPPMDDNMRKEMVKICHRKREEAKVSVRNVRREANDLIRKQKADGILAEDRLKSFEKNIQTLTDDCCKEADSLADKKEKEISMI